MDERPFLAAVDARETVPQVLCQGIALGLPSLAMVVTDKSVVKNGIDPTAEVALATALMPARERTFEAVLYKIVGTFQIAAKQRAGETAQPGNVRFNKRG